VNLDFIHGYRSKDVRNNLRYTKNGNNNIIVYHASSLGIVHDIKNNE
jgi:hypothetical protein